MIINRWWRRVLAVAVAGILLISLFFMLSMFKIVKQQEYEKAKPHPAPYLAGLKKFQASKEESIVVEDSQRGLSSAYAAGIDCIMVKNDFTSSHDFSNAQYFINQLNDLEELLENKLH